MFVALSSVRATAAGVYDVEVKCELCGYHAWARVRGQADAQSMQGHAYAVHAAHAYAHAEAIRKARGCPCPHCGRHDPQTVAWASLAEKRARRRQWWRRWFGPVTLPLVPAGAAAFCALELLHLRSPTAEGFVLGLVMVGASWILAVPIAYFALAPRKELAPHLYDTPPPDVLFQPIAAYR
jgi:hypothetical protein